MRTNDEHYSFSSKEEIDMQGFVHDIAALISLTTFVASIGVLSEVLRLVV